MRSTGFLRGWAIGLGALLQLWVVDSAAADIYKWVDEAGRLHFSQDLGRVPPEYREQALAEASRPKARDPLQRYSTPQARASGPRPSGRPPRPGETIRIPFERHGTLMKVDARVNGVATIPFYIDTGASGVSIPYDAAQRIGIAIGPDTPRVQANTANGVVSEPLVTLKSIQLGTAQVTDVPAMVSGSMNIGLLGGAFFNNFVYQVDSAAGVITLTRNQQVRDGLTADQWRQLFREVQDPLRRVEAYLAEGNLLDKGRVRELEQRRDALRVALDRLELRANRSNVPQGWRE